jgi:hypothetical protein
MGGWCLGILEGRIADETEAFELSGGRKEAGGLRVLIRVAGTPPRISRLHQPLSAAADFASSPDARLPRRILHLCLMRELCSGQRIAFFFVLSEIR